MKRTTQLAELFKQARRKLGVGQRFMAKAASMPPSNWARYETGERWPNIKAINTVKRLLKIPEDQLLAQKGTTAIPNIGELNQEDQELLTAKWWLEIHKLEKQIAQSLKGYEKAREQRLVQAEELHAIQVELEPAQQILEEIKTTQAKPDIIEWQQQKVSKLLAQHKRASTSPVFKDNVQLAVKQAEIDLLRLRKKYLENRLAEIKENA